MPVTDAVQCCDEFCGGETFGTHGTDIRGEQHHVHVDVEAVLQGQARIGHAVGGVDRQREVAQGIRHAYLAVSMTYCADSCWCTSARDPLRASIAYRPAGATQ